MNEPTDEELTAIYNEANGIDMSEAGNWMPSTCLAAMRLAMEKARKEQKEVDAKVCRGFASQFARQARGGDNSGASDHMENASNQCADEIEAQP